MRTKIKLFLMLVLFLITLTLSEVLASSQYDWQLVRDDDGIQVYLKEFWADPIKSFRGIAHINSSVDSLLAVIIDINACTDWVHRCKNPILLLRKSFSECYHYQVHKLPFPAQNREFIFHSQISRSTQTGAVRIQMRAIPEFCQINSKKCSAIKKSLLVRVKHSHGHYLLEPVAKNITKVTWTHHTNPEGHLPIWLVNKLIKDMPYRTLQGLRKKVLSPKYQKAKLVLNTLGEITNLVVTE
ncbi:MAG: hypothetical protein KZQ64_14045 [gamma proteobacterium symbiont of Bathyaustriella thionipta]|nr:hypothetical protein [gamma proteobacterium symbiont of Bathyaustriella thionipta]MCU7948549.1 hypothetical protein [gamma proteobacterium symbiont of Bathyaustriella thionipta]MCU7954492.1 hypothetical protein [gamma proteobacterium symbiont of Bathyaustriella thionipta]MCU7955173.1 hypothetical protein [gamma proteobacterium symbiont of Bathyaustriella thionipta]MCU7966506.1 hypothetical protein [gamma proteobacterium symbiont of Bathyaustriella thionipta]